MYIQLYWHDFYVFYIISNKLKIKYVEFLSSNQGSENSGNLLYVDTTGDVTYAEPDGETITIENKTITGKNLINPNDPDYTTAYFLNASGTQTPCGQGTSYGDNFGCTGYIEVTPGETYTYTCIPAEPQTGNIRVHAFNSSKTWISEIFHNNGTEWDGLDNHKSFVVPANCAYVRCNILHETGIMSSTLQLEEGDTATTPEPYVERQANVVSATASVPFEEIETYVADAVQAAIAGLDVTFSAPKLTNPNCRTDKTTFRVLDIGNSFTYDCTSYMSSLVDYLVANKGLNVSNVSFSVAYRGGASYKNWFDIFHDNDTSSYTISQVFGGLTETYPGNHGAGQGECFRNCLKDHKYDLIIVHQVSTYSGASNGWEGSGADGYLKEFVQLLRYYQPQAHIGFLMVHASPRQQQTGETNTRNQWRRIADSANWIARNYDMDFVVPAGTAVENLRISNVAPNAAHQLTRDNHHMADGLCRYTGTCAYWESVFAPYFGISCYNSGWVYQQVTPPSGYETDTVQINAVNAQVAQMCVMLANTDRYLLNNPDGKYVGPEDEVPTPPEPTPTPTPTDDYVQVPLSSQNNLEQGWWAWQKIDGSDGTTIRSTPAGQLVDGSVYHLVEDGTGEGYNNNGPTQVFFRPKDDLVVPVNSMIKLPTGISARCNWLCSQGIWRDTTLMVGDGSTYFSLNPADRIASDPDYSPAYDFTRVYLNIYKPSDAGSTGARDMVTDAYIDARVAEGIELWTAKQQYNKLTLGTDNVGKGWWSIRDTAGGSYIATGGTVLDYYETFIVGNGTSHSMIALPAVPVGSKLVLPAGMTCRRNFYNADTKKWVRMSTTDVATTTTTLELNYENEYGELSGGAQYCVVQVFRTGRDGKDTVDDAYLNAMIADGVALYTPASPWTTVSLSHSNSLAGYWCWKNPGSSDWPTGQEILDHEDELLTVDYVGVKDNATTQSYIALPEVPCGSRLTIPEGYTVRLNFTDDNHTKFFRNGSTITTGRTVLLDHVGLTKAVVQILKTGDASSSLVTDSYIDTQVNNFTLETPNS